MRIDPITLDIQNKLIHDYRTDDEKLMQFFDYPLTSHGIHKRMEELANREFKRSELAKLLVQMNSCWGAPPSTLHNIKRLEDDESFVVIGGQQAGLLTGPMYTINKLISIIQFARKQEKQLGKPVIPVFWIAGEDHDFDEINHIYLPELNQMKKYKLQQQVQKKYPLSDIDIDVREAKDWIHSIFSQLTETKNTKNIYEIIVNCLTSAKTYVDFFAHVLFQIFPNEGIVLIDSGNRDLRHLETDYFLELIHKQPQISNTVYETHRQLMLANYQISLNVEENSGHLFYHKDQERILLFRDREGNWLGKNNEVMLTTSDLIDTAENNPELLSNNVVTRPLMQDLLFPTLAFIGGPGEISYWAVLKKAFHTLNIKMPPVIPRLSFTFIDDNTEKLLRRYHISELDILQSKGDYYKQKWLQSEHSPPVDEMVKQLKKTIEMVHQPLRETARNLRSDLGELAEKNLEYIFREIDFLEKRIQKAIGEKYADEIKAFDHLNNCLHPAGTLQERIWTPLPWINLYGVDFIRQLAQEDCSFNNNHYLVRI